MTQTQSTYQRAVEQARTSTLDRAAVRRGIERVRRRAAVPTARAHRWHGPSVALGAGFSAAATVVMVLALHGPATPPAAAPMPAPELVQVGERVAIAPDHTARYRLAQSDDALTEVVVLEGAVTARLYRGATPHRLRLEGGDVTATATGTTYTLVVPAVGRARVVVHEGEVEVVDRAAGGRAARVGEGNAWPSRDPSGVDEAFSRARDRLARYRPQVDRRAELPSPREPPPPPAGARPAPAARTAEDLWNEARLLRHQGKASEALDVLRTLQKRQDDIFSSLAVIEEIRIYDAVLLEPEQVDRLSGDFLARYPEHRLVDEVRIMQCNARVMLAAELPPHCATD